MCSKTLNLLVWAGVVCVGLYVHKKACMTVLELADSLEKTGRTADAYRKFSYVCACECFGIEPRHVAAEEEVFLVAKWTSLRTAVA